MTVEETKDQCEELQTSFLESRELIIAANRGPVTFSTSEDGDSQFKRGKGGLVTALLGLCLQAEATWIACAQSEAGATWQAGNVPLSVDGKSVRVEFLSPDPAAYHGYYNVISNPLLWFLQHSMWDLSRAPVIDRDTWQAWEQYVAINQMFAEAIVGRVFAAPGPKLVMLQDYHLYLVGQAIRDRVRRPRRPAVLHFVHNPWPGPEYWCVLPPVMRQAILHGLCGVGLLGFQTHEDGLNFIRTCETHLPGAFVNLKRSRVWYRHHTTHVQDFPISINVEALKELSRSLDVATHRHELEEAVGNRQLILRIDRVEPSKNIVRGFQAYAEMLELHPEHRGQVTFVAILVPSRLEVGEYQAYLDEITRIAGRINTQYGSSEWEPIRLLIGENYPRAVAAMQLYDVLVVNSIADGMNLVAMEGPTVNQRDGVLVLSERTGASQRLAAGATVISPYDVFATGHAIHQGLTMPLEERQQRANRLRWLIERDDINIWLCRQLDTVLKLNL